MSHTSEGEHTQEVWLTDRELDIARRALRLYLYYVIDWTSPEMRALAEKLRDRLEALK